MVLRKNRVEIGNSGLLVFVSNHEEEGSLKNCAESAFSLTATLLAICLTILSPHGFAQTEMVLVTTGSTMLEPLYVLWGDEYHKLHPETQLRYLAVGTSESANRVLSGTGGDLGGGDAPIPEKQLKEAAHAAVELPTVLVGIAVFYNVPGSATSIRLSGPVLANIYLGKTTSWSDPEIARLNPDGKLPALPIKVLHRTDGKGSNYIFPISFPKSAQNSEPRSERMFRQSGRSAPLLADVRICWPTLPRRRAPSGMPSSVVARKPGYRSREFAMLPESL